MSTTQLSLFVFTEPVCCNCGKPGGDFQMTGEQTRKCATCLVKALWLTYPVSAPSDVVARTCEHCGTVVDRADQLHLCYCENQLNSCRECLAAERTAHAN